MPTHKATLRRSASDAEIRYYIAQAHEARAEYFANAVRRGFAGVVKFVHRLGHGIRGSMPGTRDGRAEA